MFDLAVECGASINIKNRMNMTPLTVAAYLARQEMFFHIANIEREVYWQIGQSVRADLYKMGKKENILFYFIGGGIIAPGFFFHSIARLNLCVRV